MTSVVPLRDDSFDLTSIDIRRQRFIAYMLIYGHEQGGPARAYKEAGYNVTPNIDQLANKLLKAPEVQSALQAAQHAHASKVDIQADRVLQELALLAFSDISHYKMDENGMMEIDEVFSPAVSRAVQSVEYTETITRGRDERETVTKKMKIKLWDKNVALTNLMKYLGMLVSTNVNLNLNGKLPMDVAREAIARARQAHALPMQFATEKERMTPEDIQVSVPNERYIERHGEVEQTTDIVGEEEEGEKQPPPLESDWEKKPTTIEELRAKGHHYAADLMEGKREPEPFIPPKVIEDESQG